MTTYPACLLLPDSYAGANREAHNREVRRYKMRCRNPEPSNVSGMIVFPTPGARMILDMIGALVTFVEVNPAPDYYGREHVVSPLVDAINNALNYDFGGLDGGTLSSYVCAIAESYGVPQ